MEGGFRGKATKIDRSVYFVRSHPPGTSPGLSATRNLPPVMNRIAPVNPVHATSPNTELFAAVKAKLGVVPNLMRTFAHSPAAFQGYLALGGALDQASLPAR